MPAVSKKQQKFFGIVRAIQKGEMAPTTPETAKAAADMKKGDVKKFASTKHKGLPEKKKIEEDRQIKKIIKQLRKSVKAHDKQADTLEKKVKTFKESNFTNITIGNKIGQTFQHVSGATVTLDNTMSNSSDQQQFVSIAGEPVAAPTGNELGIAGVTMPLGNKVMQKQNSKTAKQINKQTDASDKVSKSKSAKLDENLTLDEKKVEVKKYANEIKNYNKKSAERAKDIESRIKVQIGRVNKFLSKYQEKLANEISIENVKKGQGNIRIVEGGKKIIIISHSGFNYDDSKKFNVRVYEAEPGKLITVKKGKFKTSSGPSILDNIFQKSNEKKTRTVTADTMYMNIGNEIENKTFEIADIKEIPLPPPPEHMKKNLSKGWQPVTKEDEGMINKLDAFFGTSVTGVKFAAKLAIQLARGDTTPITKSPGIGFDANATRVIHSAIKTALEANATSPSDDTQSWYNPKTGMGQVMNGAYNNLGGNPIDNITRAALGKFTFKVTPKGIQVIDDYDITRVTAIGGVSNPITDFISRVVTGTGGFTDQFGQSYDTQQTANIITGIAMRRGAELGFDMVDTEGNTIEPVYSMEDAYADSTKLATPKGFKIPINYTMPTGQTIKNLLNPSKYRQNRKGTGAGTTKTVGFNRDDTSFKKKKKEKVNESILSFKLIQQFNEESNPRIPRKKGQPANSKKHSDLYTDENPKGTIHGLGFKNVAKAKASVSKIRNSSRSHAHKIQAAVAMEQRAREMGKTSEAAVYRKYINSMKKKTKRMNEAANPAQQAAIAISMKKKGIKPKNLKEQIQFAQMQQRIRDAKEKRREQQKKSEKLYIDTKKKGVKFYDKKGSGRLKDGKKIYD